MPSLKCYETHPDERVDGGAMASVRLTGTSAIRSKNTTRKKYKHHLDCIEKIDYNNIISKMGKLNVSFFLVLI